MSEDRETSRRKRAIWIAIIVLSLPIIFLGYQRLYGSNLLKAKLHDLKVAGEEMDYRELQYPIPHATNNAVVALTNLFPWLEALDDVLRSGPPLFEYTTNGHRGILLPRIESWVHDVSITSNREMTNDWANFSAEFQLHTNIVWKVMEALEKPDFHSGYDASNCFHDLPMELYMNVRRIERLLAAAFAWHAGRNEPRQAQRCLRALAHTVSGMANERLLIAELMRLAMLSSVMDATWQSLQLGMGSDPELAQLADQIRSFEFVESSLDAMRLERSMTVERFRRLGGTGGTVAQRRREWKEAWDTTGFGFGLERSGMVEWVYVPLWHLVWKDQDCCCSLDSWATGINQLKFGRELGWANLKSGSAALSSRAPIEKSLPDTWWNEHRFLFSMQLSFFEPRDMVNKVFRAEAICRLAITAIAIHRYQQRHGNPPPNLVALTPELLDAVPVDPMDLETLRYRLNGREWLLYSVGENGRDDGGSLGAVAAGLKSVFASEGLDIVWPQPAK